MWNMLIMSSSPMISLMSAEPPDVVPYETFTSFPCRSFPSHMPSRLFSFSKVFCASLCAIAMVATSAGTTKNAIRSDFIDSLLGFSLLLQFCIAAFLHFRRFFRVLGFHECFQIRQAHAPECAVRLQPVVHSFQRFGIQLIQAVASFPVFLNQVGAPK